MEALDMQAAPAAGKKSPRLAALTRLLLQSDVEHSSSSCDFLCSREGQSGCPTRTDPCATNSNARVSQQQRPRDVARSSVTRFEQQAEQLLQQDQGLQVDQILDLLGLLLKRQHTGADREARVSHQQQASMSPCGTGAVDTRRQAQNGSALPLNTTAARHWSDADELAPHGDSGSAIGGDFSADNGAVALESLRRRRDSNSSVLRRSQQHLQGQQEQHVVSPHSAAGAGGTTATNGSGGSAAHFAVVGSNSDSQALLEHRRRHDQQLLTSGGPAEWAGNSLQQHSGAVVKPAAGAAAVGTAASKEAGAESVGRSNGSSSTACWVAQQPKSAPSSPPRLPLQLEASAVDPLTAMATTGTRLREARQQRQQPQHPLMQQHELQKQDPREQQPQLQHTRSQQYVIDQHHTPHRQNAQLLRQQPLGQRQLQEGQHLQQHQQTETKERGEIDENLLNDETRRLLSKSLDVLMGDVNLQTLKDLLLRKGPVVGNGSLTDNGGSPETSYSGATHTTPGDTACFDAAVLSLLQQEPHQRQQPQRRQHSQQPEVVGELLSRNCTPESKRQQQTSLENHPSGERCGDELASQSHAVSPTPSGATARDRRCSARSMEEGNHVTATGQRQHSDLRRVQQRQLSQQQTTQEESITTDLKTDSASVSCYFEGVSPYYRSGLPETLVKNEDLNSKQDDNAETAVVAGAAMNRRAGAVQRQELQQPEKKRGRATRPSSPKDNQEKEKRSPANGSAATDATTGCAASTTGATDQDNHEAHREVRRVRLCTGAARAAGAVGTSPSDKSPLAARWGESSLVQGNACTPVEGAGAAAARVGSRGCTRTGRSSCEDDQQAAAVISHARHQVAAASLSSRMLGERDGDVLGVFHRAAAGDESAEGAASSAGKKCLAAGDISDTEKHLAGPDRKGQAFEAAGGAQTAEAVRSGCFPLPPYRNGKRRVHEPCELALAAARLEQQGHTFTPSFYLDSPAAAMSSSSSASSRCSMVRENCKRSDAAGGGEERKIKDLECFNEGDTATGEGMLVTIAEEQQRKARGREEEQIEDKMEEQEEMEGEHLTQQQLTLLKHIYSVLSQAEEYFSFKSALYQLHIKRHLKKCVSSLAAAAAANSASSDKDASPHAPAGGGNKPHRSPVHAGSTQSKAIRLFTSMPPIPINAVEQRALLSVRKHLQAGGGGALLCQGDGVAQLLMEELDELLTSLVNKTCFIHAPARAQLREFLVSFVFPGDMATQLLFRDHVQAVVHARIRHFRDSVGRTLRHQPPPSPPLAPAPISRSGNKRSTRAATTSASSPASRETEEEGDEEEDRQKKQKLCEPFVEMAALPAGRIQAFSNRRKASPAHATAGVVAHTSTSGTPSHSAAQAAAQLDSAQDGENARKASHASRSPSNSEPHRGRSLSISDAKETGRGIGAFVGVSNRTGAPGREGGRLSRAGEHGNGASVAKTAIAGAFATAQRKGINAGAGGSAPASGCGTGANGRTRGGHCSRRKRTATAASDSAETRSPTGSCSRYGPAAATRRGGSSPSADKCARGSPHSTGGAANQRQHHSGRDTGSNNRRVGTTTGTGSRFESKASSGGAISTGRSSQYASGGAAEELSQKDCSGGSLHKVEAGRRGERATRGGSSVDASSVRTSPEATQQRSLSLVSRSPQHNSGVQQQQLLQQQQVGQTRSSSGTRGEVVGRWTPAAVPSEDMEEGCCERGLRTVAGGTEGVWGRSGSRTSILSRGSTRESACDPLAWEQADGSRPKGGPPTLSVQESHPCLFPSPGPVTSKQAASLRGSIDSGGGLVPTSKTAPGERISVGEDMPWTSVDKGEEDDEATQALAAALGGALDPSNGDSAVGAVGEVWEWLAVAAASKDEQQQEKLRQTLETLLNAWTTSGTNEGRNVRGTQGSEAPGSISRSTLGASNGSNNSADGWFNFAVADYSCGREKRSRPYQAEEVNLSPLDASGNAMHLAVSVKGPPSEASTSFPAHEERTPPAERSTAESADVDVTRSLAIVENSTSSRRESAVCVPDGSLRAERAAAGAESGDTAARGTATITEGRGGGTGALRQLRIPLPRELNRADATGYESEATAFDGVTHNTIADFLLTYCKEDATAYEIAAQLKHRETATSAAAVNSGTTAVSTSQGGVQAEAYLEPRLQEKKLVSSFSPAPADELTKNCTAGNGELQALGAEALSASHSGASSLAFSLSSFLTGSSPSR